MVAYSESTACDSRSRTPTPPPPRARPWPSRRPSPSAGRNRSKTTRPSSSSPWTSGGPRAPGGAECASARPGDDDLVEWELVVPRAGAHWPELDGLAGRLRVVEGGGRGDPPGHPEAREDVGQAVGGEDGVAVDDVDVEVWRRAVAGVAEPAEDLAAHDPIARLHGHRAGDHVGVEDDPTVAQAHEDGVAVGLQRTQSLRQ